MVWSSQVSSNSSSGNSPLTTASARLRIYRALALESPDGSQFRLPELDQSFGTRRVAAERDQLQVDRPGGLRRNLLADDRPNEGAEPIGVGLQPARANPIDDRLQMRVNPPQMLDGGGPPIRASPVRSADARLRGERRCVIHDRDSCFAGERRLRPACSYGSRSRYCGLASRYRRTRSRRSSALGRNSIA